MAEIATVTYVKRNQLVRAVMVRNFNTTLYNIGWVEKRNVYETFELIRK